MLYRKRATDIKKWLKESRKALLVTGARQVGKTYLIERVLEEEKADYVKIDLIQNPELADVLDDTGFRDVESFLSRIKLYTGKEMVKGETVIFIDEIQKAKDIITKVKYLVEEGSYRYVFSGSLLGVELFDLRSAPVGYMETLDMYPMDFEEFLIAQNMNRDVLEILRRAYEEKAKVDELIHQRVMEMVYEYLVVGGMPEAVDEYSRTGDFNRVAAVHGAIIPQYKSDFSQYENRNKKLRLNNMYNLIPAELNKKNKRYYFNHLDRNYKNDRYEDSILWLINAGVAIPTYNSSEPKIPLIANEKSNLFKMFASDVGLLTNQYGRATILDILDGSRTMNFGAEFENFVAQELNAHGYKTFYYNSKKKGELDFVIEYRNKCLPIEVKSGKDYSIHSALNNVITDVNYDIEEAIVLCSDNVRQEGKVSYLPIYMTMFIDDKSGDIPHFPKKDLSDLRAL